ncbi:MAG TPA: hypothetical protein VNF73_09830 [Candidatus Saccharimonadales bacterium]|nr:hypothetical protein [Candidatus Saccharimonadales bacterium]
MREPVNDRWQVVPRNSDGTRRRVPPPGPHIGSLRLTPTRVTLFIALAGSTLFLIYSITVRDASQIPMLSSGAAVLGIVFSALALAGLIGTYRAGRAGAGGRAMVLAIGGGIAAMIAAGCFSAAVILALVYRQ